MKGVGGSREVSNRIGAETGAAGVPGFFVMLYEGGASHERQAKHGEDAPPTTWLLAVKGIRRRWQLVAAGDAPAASGRRSRIYIGSISRRVEISRRARRCGRGHGREGSGGAAARELLRPRGLLPPPPGAPSSVFFFRSLAPAFFPSATFAMISGTRRQPCEFSDTTPPAPRIRADNLPGGAEEAPERCGYHVLAGVRRLHGGCVPTPFFAKSRKHTIQ